MVVWDKMWQFLATFLGVWAILFFFNTSAFIRFVSFGFLGLFVADLILKFRAEFFTEKLYIRRVKQKAVVITGCDSGFGHKLARRLANMGFTVFAGCLLPEEGGAKELATHNKIKVLKLDVTNQQDIDKARETVEEELKKSDLKLWSVVNNAGISISGEVELLNMDAYRRVMDVNAFGPLAVTKTFLPLLRRAGEGRVVTVASLAGRFTMYGFTAYSMSKHAAVSFSDGLRCEMRKWNISVHSVEPGLYRTNICDEEKLKMQYEKLWKEAPNEAKEAYGKEYFDARTKASLQHAREIARGEDKVHEVVDDLVDAVSSETPKTRYMPSLGTKVLTRVLQALPFEVVDWFWLRPYSSIRPLTAPTLRA